MAPLSFFLSFFFFDNLLERERFSLFLLFLFIWKIFGEGEIFLIFLFIILWKMLGEGELFLLSFALFPWKLLGQGEWWAPPFGGDKGDGWWPVRYTPHLGDDRGNERRRGSISRDSRGRCNSWRRRRATAAFGETNASADRPRLLLEAWVPTQEGIKGQTIGGSFSWTWSFILFLLPTYQNSLLNWSIRWLGARPLSRYRVGDKVASREGVSPSPTLSRYSSNPVPYPSFPLLLSVSRKQWSVVPHQRASWKHWGESSSVLL